MMGSRGGAPLQQADTLVVISEWMELMKGAGKTLPAAVAQYRTAKEEADQTLERVAAAQAGLSNERVELQKKAAELDERKRKVAADEAAIATNRETLRQGSEALARVEAENERLNAELNEQLAGIAAQRAVAETEIRNAKAALNGEIEAALANRDREKRAAQAAIEQQQSDAAAERAELRERTYVEVRERMAKVVDRETKLAEREAATREHAAALAALAHE